jgi:hypothetical protein
MENRHLPLLQRLRAAVVDGSGTLDKPLREAIVEGKAQAGDLGAFAERVQHSPASVTDEHVRALVAAGHPEDAVFEVIICAALAAGLERLEAGRRAIEAAT